jgi:hypothetical protein
LIFFLPYRDFRWDTSKYSPPFSCPLFQRAPTQCLDTPNSTATAAIAPRCNLPGDEWDKRACNIRILSPLLIRLPLPLLIATVVSAVASVETVATSGVSAAFIDRQRGWKSAQIAILRVWAAFLKHPSRPQQIPLLLSLTTATGGLPESSVAPNARSMVDRWSKCKKNEEIPCLCEGKRRLQEVLPTRNVCSRLTSYIQSGMDIFYMKEWLEWSFGFSIARTRTRSFRSIRKKR